MLRKGLFVIGMMIIFSLTIYPVIFTSLVSTNCLPELYGVDCSVECVKNETGNFEKIIVCEDDKCNIFENLTMVCEQIYNFTYYLKYNTSCVRTPTYGWIPYSVGLICDYKVFDVVFLLLFLLMISSGVGFIVCFPTFLYDMRLRMKDASVRSISLSEISQ